MLELPGGEALRVELSAFTGPLDLLLHLIKEQEMDIYDIRLEKLTEQYLSRLDKMREENLSVAGEFLVMAATLVYLKSRSLLPVQDRLPEDVEDEDPKWELIRQLIEYRKFKEAAGQLGDREALHSRIFGRTPERVVAPAALQGPGQVSMFDLVWAFQKILRNVEDRARAGRFQDEEFTVGQKIEFLLDRMTPGGEVIFEDLFRTASSRGEVVVTFLALLELIRLQQLAAWQEGPLMPIRIRRAPEPVSENLPLGVPEEVPQIPREGAGQSPDLSAV
ncbi:MAG: chromosome segregation protein ScpA [Verrucomicrobia bacterium]|nr:chromosome segregation protein ScpA [Verrucomicrobiota bacterium]